MSENTRGRTRTLSFADDTSFEPKRKLQHSYNNRSRRYGQRQNDSDANRSYNEAPSFYINLSRSRGFSFLSDISEVSRVSTLQESIHSEIDEETDKENTKLIKRTYFRNIFACNIAFFLLFSSFVGLSIVQNSINGSLGSLSLSLIFLVTIISCMVISPISIRFLGYKHTMVACFIAFTTWEVSNFHPVLGTFIPASIICGIGNGAIWASQATYFSQQNILYSKITGEPAHLVMSKSFGLFFCFVLSGTSFGCLLTSLILNSDLTKGNNTLSQSSGSQMPNCGSGYCPPENIDADDGSSTNPSISSYQPQSRQIVMMVAIHSALTVVGLLLIIFLVENICEDYSSDKPLLSQALQSVKACMKQLKRKRQILLTPLNIYTGLSKSFMLADITQAFIGCALGVEMIGYGSVLYGLISCASAISSGFILRRTGRVPIFVAAMVVAVCNCIFLLIWTPDTSQMPLFFVIPALWALPDGILLSQMNSLYGMIFHDNAQGAFASFRLWEGIGLVTGYIFNYVICVRNKIYTLLVLLSFGMTGYFITEKVQKNLDKSKATLQASVDHLSLSFSFSAQNTQDSFNTSSVIAHWSQPQHNTSQGYPKIFTLDTIPEETGPCNVFESNV